MYNQAAFDFEEAMAVLERTPASIQALLQGLPDRWLKATEGPDSWSPYQVVDHLIQGEQTNWIVRAQHILSGDQRPFTPFDRVGRFAQSQTKPVSELLATFAELRQANIATLRELNPSAEDLAKTGQHPEFGTVRLDQLLATWAVHDLNHIGQIVQTMAKAYTEAVGPWRAYLSILDAAEKD